MVGEEDTSKMEGKPASASWATTEAIPQQKDPRKRWDSQRKAWKRANITLVSELSPTTSKDWCASQNQVRYKVLSAPNVAFIYQPPL